VIRASMIAAILLLAAATRARAEPVFLVVGASANDPSVIAAKVRELRRAASEGLVVNTMDCGEANHIFAFAVVVTASMDEAQGALHRVRSGVKDAYIKRCEARPGSLLSLRIDAVDPSIAQVPKDAVNWTVAARVSSALPLSVQASFVIIRYFVELPDDPLEGQRERVVFAKTNGQRVTLADNCFDPGRPAISDGLIAFDCAREEAGDQLLHSTIVVTEGGRHLRDIEHCRVPKWIAARRLECNAEAVTAGGKLTLTPERVDIENQ
jgi:hypothetical protein